ncbi:MAG: hypothetical protein KJO82_11165, partial [Gammaproteobacteria bacterium]|nr:hypothetical protein [Gammaproteobacteria bacterium]
MARWLPRGPLVGEFIMVVLGVLFALMVDSWLTDRADDKLRDEYLARLIDDLKTDRLNLDDRIYFFDAVQAFGVETLKRLESGDAGGIVSVVEAFYAAENYDFRIVDNTYLDLQNTGNIRLLDQIELRASLAAYHTKVAAQREQLSPEYRSMVRGIIPWHVQNAIRNNCPTTDSTNDRPTGFPPCDLPDVSEEEARAAFSQIRNSPGLYEVLTYRVSQVG